MRLYPDEILKISPTTVDVKKESGSFTFNIESNVLWKVTTKSAWCKAFDSNIGNGSFDVVYTENSTGKDRIAEINVQGLNLNTIVKVFQYC